MAAELILQQIIEQIKCAECTQFLRPPISYCSNNTNLCQSCADNTSHTITGVNTQLESIGNLLKFPCTYNSFGCKTVILWSEAQLHESECPFRQFSCPACNNWNGTAKDLKTHVEGHHKEMLLSTTKPNFSLLQNRSMYFVVSMGELFVVLYNCDTDSGLLWFTIKSAGPLEHAKRRHFRLILQQNSDKYFERKQVESAVNWEIDEESAIKIDLCVLKMKLQLKHETVVQLHVEVYSRTPLYNGTVDEDLLRDVECPVCQDYMNAPIHQCAVGHSICGYCKPKLKSCPTCKGALSETRNYALESVCSKMYYRCMYTDDGCTFASLPKNIFTHENSCDFGLFDCPFKTFISHCTWRGKLDQMSSHTLEEHGWKF